MPIIGDSTMNRIVLIQPAGMTAENPARATAAPAYPPSSAWEELEGMPYHHVTRFQVMAPSRPARMTSGFTMLMSIIPEPMVLATWVPKTNSATKLKNAAMATAAIGLRTRVPTTVAMELAAS